MNMERGIYIYIDTYVHGFAPNHAINGDMGWTPCRIRRKIEMLRLWNKLQSMDNRRITKHIFLWDIAQHSNTNNWSRNVMDIFDEIGEHDSFVNNATVSLNWAWGVLFQKNTQNHGNQALAPNPNCANIKM